MSLQHLQCCRTSIPSCLSFQDTYRSLEVGVNPNSRDPLYCPTKCVALPTCPVTLSCAYKFLLPWFVIKVCGIIFCSFYELTHPSLVPSVLIYLVPHCLPSIINFPNLTVPLTVVLPSQKDVHFLLSAIDTSVLYFTHPGYHFSSLWVSA